MSGGSRLTRRGRCSGCVCVCVSSVQGRRESTDLGGGGGELHDVLGNGVCALGGCCARAAGHAGAEGGEQHGSAEQSPGRIDVTGLCKGVRPAESGQTPQMAIFVCSSPPMQPPPPVGTRLSHGGHTATLKYVGPVDNTQGLWLGVDWDTLDRGKNDGSKDGKRYFTCRSARSLRSAINTRLLISTATKRQDPSCAQRHILYTVYRS